MLQPLRGTRCTSPCAPSMATRSARPQLVLVHDMSFVARRSEETRSYLFYFFIALGACDRAHHGRHRAALLARLGARSARAPARRGHPATVAPAATAPELRPIARDMRRPDPRSRAPVPPARRQPAHLGPAGAARDAAQRAARQRRDRGGEPRALHPHAHRRGHPAAASGERARHRARAGHARVLRHLDRARQRLRRPRDRRSQGPHRRAAGAPALPGAAHLAHQGRRARLLRGIRERGAVAALPHRPCAPDVSRERLRAVPDASTAKFADAVAAEAKSARTRWSSSRTITSRCCRG